LVSAAEPPGLPEARRLIGASALPFVGTQARAAGAVSDVRRGMLIVIGTAKCGNTHDPCDLMPHLETGTRRGMMSFFDYPDTEL
jgi:hypothetical protein